VEKKLKDVNNDWKKNRKIVLKNSFKKVKKIIKNYPLKIKIIFKKES